MMKLSEPSPSRMDRHQHRQQTSWLQRCTTPAERARRLELSRNNEYVCLSASTCLWLKHLFLCAWHSSCWKTKPLFKLILATGNNRDTIHELLLARRYVWKLCHLVSCSTPRTVDSTTRERGINENKNRVDLDVRLRRRRQTVFGFVSTVSSARRAAFTAPALLSSLPSFFVMHDCCRAVLNSCDTVSCRKVSLLSSVVCVWSRSIVSTLHLWEVSMRETLRTWFRWFRRSPLCLGCEPRGSATRLLCPPYRRVWPTWYSRTSLECFVVVADCCRGSCCLRLRDWLSLSWAGWLRGRGPELLLRYHARVAHLPVVDWARILRRPPTASPVILGTGVLWVSTRTHPCGSPSRQDDGETRAPALQTLDDVLRFRGDEEYRAVLLHPSSTCSCLRSGRSWEHHFVIDCVVCCVRPAGFLSQCWGCTLHWSSACHLCTPSGTMIHCKQREKEWSSRSLNTPNTR